MSVMKPTRPKEARDYPTAAAALFAGYEEQPNEINMLLDEPYQTLFEQLTEVLSKKEGRELTKEEVIKHAILVANLWEKHMPEFKVSLESQGKGGKEEHEQEA